MPYKIHFFAQLKEIVGQATIQLHLEQPVNGEQLLAQLSAQYPPLKTLESQIQIAVNQQHQSLQTTIPLGATVAFFPPVSGG